MTAAFWFKHNAIVTNDWGTMLAKGSGSIRNYAFFISPNTTKFEFQEYNFTAPSGQQGLFLSSVTTPTLGVWYHVAVTVQGSAIRLYVNGVLDASGTTPVPATTGTEPLTFGRSSWGGYRPYPGVVDDIRIYSRALSADEIAALTATKAYDDTDGDGIPDYLEDRNGNGLYETGDISSWATWDTDGDGMSDGQELQLGTNANLNESAQSGLRINYSYDPSGWLRQVTGARGETVGLDPEGNVQQVSP
jgi:hypothetical protein